MIDSQCEGVGEFNLRVTWGSSDTGERQGLLTVSLRVLALPLLLMDWTNPRKMTSPYTVLSFSCHTRWVGESIWIQAFRWGCLCWEVLMTQAQEATALGSLLWATRGSVGLFPQAVQALSLSLYWGENGQETLISMADEFLPPFGDLWFSNSFTRSLFPLGYIRSYAGRDQKCPEAWISHTLSH